MKSLRATINVHLLTKLDHDDVRLNSLDDSAHVVAALLGEVRRTNEVDFCSLININSSYNAKSWEKLTFKKVVLCKVTVYQELQSTYCYRVKVEPGILKDTSRYSHVNRRELSPILTLSLQLFFCVIACPASSYYIMCIAI